MSLAAGAFAAATPVLTRHPQVAASGLGTPFAAGTRTEGATERGTLVSNTALAVVDADSIRAGLRTFGLDALRVRFGVEPSRIIYRTIDPEGRPTTASGLVVLPSSGDRDLPLVSWLHGTTVYRGEAASVDEAGPDRAIAVLFASAGYAVSAPDYLGLGLGPGRHPYDDIPSTVTASLDALRATRALAT